MLGIGVAVSLVDFTELLYEAGRGALAAIWLVPAVLLLWRAPGLGTAAGLLLVANCVRLLASYRVPGSRSRAKDAGSGGSFLAAFAVQCALVSAAAGNWILAAVLVGSATAIWVRSSIARGAYVPGRPAGWVHWLLSTALTALVMAAAPASALPGDGEAPGAFSLAGVAERLFPSELEREKKLTEPLPKQTVSTQLVNPPKELRGPDVGGFPGAILRPEARPPRPGSVTLPAKGGVAGTGGTRAVVIPFTGEYRLYPDSFAELPPGAIVFHESPLNIVYMTLIEASMQTEAYQRFEPAIDFSGCGKVRLTFRSGEVLPASATMLLVMAEREVELGPEFFALEPRPEETLDFTVPDSVRGYVKGVRVMFLRNPAQAKQNARIEVKAFELVPRG